MATCGMPRFPIVDRQKQDSLPARLEQQLDQRQPSYCPPGHNQAQLANARP